ncbi:hypothetical protein BRD02_02685 [Halobacteriales archaeon QS_8_69_73]|nr:MAG: hypothetical protein BRD02_02685 [Halobacteriales archaeon QS_8_69_73]
MDSDMPEDVRDVHKLRAIGGVVIMLLGYTFMLLNSYSFGAGIVMALYYVLEARVSIESTIGPPHLFVLSLIPSVTGLTWLYFTYLEDPTDDFLPISQTYSMYRGFVYNTFDDPAAVEQWADAPLPDRTRRWLAVVTVGAPVTVFAITQLDTTFLAAFFGLLLAVGFVQLIRTATDTISLRPFSQHIRYIFAGPFVLGLTIIPIFLVMLVLTQGAIPAINILAWSGLVTFIALYIAACVSGHCATLLYDSRKIDAGQQPDASTTDSTQPSERPSTTTDEKSSGAATGSGGTVPTQVFVTLAGVLVIQAVGALIFLPFSPAVVAAAAIAQSVAIFGAARYIAPEAVRPRAILVGGGAVGGLGFLLGAEAVGRSTNLELLADLSGGIAVMTIGFIAMYIVVAGVSNGPSSERTGQRNQET